MIKIQYPSHEFRTRSERGVQMIFDELRRSWLKLTPEEWVRQHFVQFLLSKQIPSALIALEKVIRVGELNKRFDILVFNRDYKPWMIVECKAMNVSLSPDVLHQVLRYNIGAPSEYLLITNGTYCIGFTKHEGKLVEVEQFPEF